MITKLLNKIMRLYIFLFLHKYLYLNIFIYLNIMYKKIFKNKYLLDENNDENIDDLNISCEDSMDDNTLIKNNIQINVVKNNNSDSDSDEDDIDIDSDDYPINENILSNFYINIIEDNKKKKKIKITLEMNIILCNKEKELVKIDIDINRSTYFKIYNDLFDN